MTSSELDYLQRVNRAIDHVVTHLDQPLPLEAVAKVAHFSPFHFHRVFRAMVGEPLHQFVRRLRLERALTLMSREPRRPLTEVALQCGFSSSSDFSRSFKQRYGVPPSAIDLGALRDAGRAELAAGHRLERLPAGANPDGFQVELQDLPARTVAYLRVMDPYRGGVFEATQRLVRWAEARGRADGQWLGYQWDDPEVVPLDKCRYDVGLEIPEHVSVSGDVSVTRFAAMKVAELEIKGPIELEMRAIDWIFTTWLPSSAWAPANQPCFEVWNGKPFAHGMTHFELRMHLPVVGLDEPI
jgi:AraC family transcriptional regulator